MTYEELYHYGVKGMKWGVRRDARLLTSGRRNKRVRYAKDAYNAGKITKAERDAEIRNAQRDKKTELTSIKQQFANAKTPGEQARLEKNLARQTLREIPNATLKRGAANVNALFGVMNATSMGFTTATVMSVNPAFAGAAVAAGVVGVAAEAGFRYAAQLGLDKLS